MSQPPYGQNPYGAPPPDPTMRAPVDPFYSGGAAQPGYEQPQEYQQQYPGTPGYSGWSDPNAYPEQPVSGYPEAQPVSGYPGAQSYTPTPGYGAAGYPQQQPGYGAPGYPGGPGGPGYPTAPSGGGGGRSLTIVLVIVLALVVVGGVAGAVVLLSGNNKKTTTQQSSGPTGAPASTGTTTGPTAAPTGKTHSGDIRAFLVGLPSGAYKCSNPTSADEKLDLDRASSLSGDPTQRKKELQTDNFVDGAARCWVDKAKNSVEVRLYHFATTDDALSFYNSDIDGTSGGYSASSITDISGVPEGKEFADPKKDSDNTFSVIGIGHKADVVFVVALRQSQGDQVDLTVPDDLMRQQYQKL